MNIFMKLTLLGFPIIGLNLTVNYPKDYEFEIVVQSFSNKLEEISSSEGKKSLRQKSNL